MKQILITLIIIIAVACQSERTHQSEREPIQRTYLGVTLGKTTMAEAKEALSGYEMDASSVEGTQVLVFKEPKVLGIKFKAGGVFFGNGVPDSIAFMGKVEHFDSLMQTIADKNGEPVKSVQFDCDTYTWVDDSTVVELMYIAKADTIARLMIRNKNIK